MPRAQVFCLSYGYTYHKCLTFCSHDADCCKLLFTLGFTEAAWARRMNALELTSSLPHLPLPTNTPVGCWLRTKGQESAEELALLQLLFLVQNEVSGLFFCLFFKREKAGQWWGQKSSKGCVMTVCQRKVYSALWQWGIVSSTLLGGNTKIFGWFLGLGEGFLWSVQSLC